MKRPVFASLAALAAVPALLAQQVDLTPHFINPVIVALPTPASDGVYVMGDTTVRGCVNNPDWPAWHAFRHDNGNTGRCLPLYQAMTNAPLHVYITYSFPAPQMVNGYAVRGLFDNGVAGSLNRNPKKWKFEGSNGNPDSHALDSGPWTLLHEMENEPWFASLEMRTYSTTDSGAFQHYRFTILENHNNGVYGLDFAGVQELEFYHVVMPPPQVETLRYESVRTDTFGDSVLLDTVKLNGRLTAGWNAEVFFIWGDSPDNLVNTNHVGSVVELAAFNSVVVIQESGRTHWYDIVATNNAGTARLPAPVPFFARAEDITGPGKGTPFGSDTYGGYTSTNAFDNDFYTPGGRWLEHVATNGVSTMPVHAGFSFPKKMVLTGYGVFGLGQPFPTTRTPRKWEVEGSNDLANWVVVDARENPTGWGDYEAYFFPVFKLKSFQHWRFKIIENNGDAVTGVVELEFYGYEGPGAGTLFMVR